MKVSAGMVKLCIQICSLRNPQIPPTGDLIKLKKYYEINKTSAYNLFNFDADPDPGSALIKWIWIQIQRMNAILEEKTTFLFFAQF